MNCRPCRVEGGAGKGAKGRVTSDGVGSGNELESDRESEICKTYVDNVTYHRGGSQREDVRVSAVESVGGT
jgi:hypothetical protein